MDDTIVREYKLLFVVLISPKCHVKHNYEHLYSSCFKCGFTMQAMVSKMGPWGGNGGDTCDIKVIPHHLESVIICSGTIIDALAFSYWDRNGHRHTTQFWGGILGDVQTVSKLNK
jgi:hypothetical protein